MTKTQMTVKSEQEMIIVMLQLINILVASAFVGNLSVTFFSHLNSSDRCFPSSILIFIDFFIDWQKFTIEI